MTWDEFISLLKTADTPEEINSRREEIANFIPEIRIMFDFDQKNYAHPYDLWMHCVHTVLNLPRDIDDDMLYLAALLHDIGKPECQCHGAKPEDTNMHYYGHPEKGAEIIKERILPALEENGVILSEDEKRRLLYYVTYHDDRMSFRPKHMCQHLQMVSYEEFQKLMLLEVADAKAHTVIPIIADRIEICSQLAGEKGLEIHEQYQELFDECER